ncbi:CHAT domain-containing protein, partial [Streptomyces sp. SID3343]|uniref:CHAT domain-containing protein n=1 Tax=Streptomyces sp. SID3343 TaxID=2690260 RepID=UPI001367AA12
TAQPSPAAATARAGEPARTTSHPSPTDAPPDTPVDPLAPVTPDPTHRPAAAATRTVPHVLYIGASPDDHAQLRVDRGLRELLGIAEWGGIVVEPVPAAMASDLRRIRATRPDILHLACHGSGESLLFEDIHGEEHAVSAHQIVRTLRLYRDEVGIRLRGLVLASCDSEAIVEQFRGTADTVVAHTGPLDDLCANAFAGLFYREVAHGLGLAGAARVAARLTVLDNESCEALESGLVVLS